MIDAAHYHLSYFAEYHMRVLMPDTARNYDRLHAELAEDPTNRDLQETIVAFIARNQLKERPEPDGYHYETGQWKKAINVFRATGKELMPRPPKVEPHHYHLSACRLAYLWTRAPKTAARYERLHAKLALNPHDVDSMEELLELIGDLGLRKIPRRFDQSPAEFNEISDRARRAHEEREKNGYLG